MTTTEFNDHIASASKTLKPFALKLTRDGEDANDLIQDTMVKAILNKDKFSEGTNLKAWLYTIMKNTFITNYQKMLRKNTFIDSTENLFHINSYDALAENDAISSFAQNDINTAINHLEDSYQTPFIMYFKGFKYEEISERLRIPLGTVKNRIHIARKELKEKLNIYHPFSKNLADVSMEMN